MLMRTISKQMACNFREGWWEATQLIAPNAAAIPDPVYRELEEKYAMPRTEESVAAKVASFIAGQMAKKVSLEIFEERKAICTTCEYLKYKDTDPACGICGCTVIKRRMFLKNLAEAEEQLPRWGCKHPQRTQGKGWRR